MHLGAARSRNSRLRRFDRERLRPLRFEPLEDRRLLANFAVGDNLRNYRLAIAATAEYTSFFGGQAQAFAAIQSFVADLNTVFEREMAVHLNLVSNQSLVFVAADPYTNGNPAAMLNENQNFFNANVLASTYDIAHVFGTFPGGGAGLSSLGVVGQNGFKAQGASTSSTPVGSDWLKLVAHEIAHQFGAPHSFNANSFEACFNNRSAPHAVEPASGSTLMSYAGICGPDSLQPDPDGYFHSASFEQMEGFIRTVPGAGPSSTTPTGNSVPTVNAGPNLTIPARTPFALAAAGSDANAGDTLTYTWEQLDPGSAPQGLPVSDTGFGPLFRSFPPATNPTRTFPRLTDLLNNINTAPLGEALPVSTRSLNFRATVRDGRGGVNSDDVLLNVFDTGIPFVVTAPNTAVAWLGGTLQNVTWNTGNTNFAPINAANVNVRLSTDGGQTFPFLLASGPNNGSMLITVPNINTTQARIKVEAAGNVFFDVSNANFTINASGTVPGIVQVESDGSTRPVEGGPGDSYLIGPTTFPAGSVTVAVTADSQTVISSDGISFFPTLNLVFTAALPQTVFVRAVNDAVNEGPHTSLITHAVTVSTSAAYPVGMLINNITAQVMDDELPPVVGVDFDRIVSGGQPPPNWTIFDKAPTFAAETLSNLIRDDGVPTSIDVSLQYDPVGFASLSATAGANEGTKPLHNPSLAHIDGFNAADVPITITWSDLVPGGTYGVYVFGLSNDPGPAPYGQNVTVTGANVVSYSQTLVDGQLRINDELGTSTRTLKSFEDLVIANAAGRIVVRVVPQIGGLPYGLGGIAIREIPPPAVPGFTVTQTGGNTQVSEAGTTDTFSVVLDAPPASNVVINVFSLDLTEVTVNPPLPLTFTPVNWSVPQTVTVTGVDDALLDGNQVSSVVLSIDDPLSDNAYDPLPDQIVSVTTLDNDVAVSTLVQLVAGSVQ
ncbi:MAG TPA: M12 family metallo-peptidase, partial [Pirellulaceae bacterium]|nr:M12 family metallo-peptidase [Pirellulaceae bacterium]